MGTRSTTKIYEGNELILSLYKQYDGFVENWGMDLIKFIESGTFVNGLNSTKQGEKERMFNGIGDLSTQLIAHFKEEAGGLYCTTAKDWQEFNYEIHYKPKLNPKTHKENGELTISCFVNRYPPKIGKPNKVKVKNFDKKWIFENLSEW